MYARPFGLLLSVATAAVVGPSVYDGYKYSTKPSGFHQAVEDIYKIDQRKYKIEEFEKAIAGIYNISGSLSKEIIWEALNRSGFFKNPTLTFIEIMGSHNHIDFSNPKSLIKNLFKTLTKEETEAIMLYAIQKTSFGRKPGVERNELKSEVLSDDLHKSFLEYAKIIGLIDSIEPTEKSYDKEWILGASRPGILTRAIYSTQMRGVTIKNDDIQVLVGERIVWAEIDGIAPELKALLMSAFYNKTPIDSLNTVLTVGDNSSRIEEGKSYMLYLAQKNNIRVNNEQPFVFYKTKEECPKGYFPERHYLNYEKGETRFITESMMSVDILETLGIKVSEI